MFGGGVYNGEGSFTWADRAWYKGCWKDGRRHGLGVYVSGDRMHVYDGEWSNNAQHGEGRQQLPDGRMFEGIFEKDLPRTGKMHLSGERTLHTAVLAWHHTHSPPILRAALLLTRALLADALT